MLFCTQAFASCVIVRAVAARRSKLVFSWQRRRRSFILLLKNFIFGRRVSDVNGKRQINYFELGWNQPN